MTYRTGTHGRPRGSRDMTGKARNAARNQERDDALLLRELARRVRAHRLEQDIAVDELAMASGCDVSTICQIERGEKRGKESLGPRLAIVDRIARALGITLSELVP